jgi:hypothetical protein
VTTASEIILTIFPDGVPPGMVPRFEELHRHCQSLAELIDSTTDLSLSYADVNSKIRELYSLGFTDTRIGAECGLAASTIKGRRLAMGLVHEKGRDQGKKQVDTSKVVSLRDSGLIWSEVTGLFPGVSCKTLQKIYYKDKAKTKTKALSDERNGSQIGKVDDPAPSTGQGYQDQEASVSSVLSDPLAEKIILMHQSGLPRFRIASLLAKENNETRTEDEIKAIISSWRDRL